MFRPTKSQQRFTYIHFNVSSQSSVPTIGAAKDSRTTTGSTFVAGNSSSFVHQMDSAADQSRMMKWKKSAAMKWYVIHTEFNKCTIVVLTNTVIDYIW